MFDLKTIPKREKINKQIRREELISKNKIEKEKKISQIQGKI